MACGATIVVMTALEAQDVGKRFGGPIRGTWVVRHIDLTVRDGSVTALVGPNGAGKSTLLKSWVGFETVSEGRVLVGDIDPRRRRADALRVIGYVPQSPSLYSELSVADHVTLARTLRHDFDEVLARRRLDDLRIPLIARADTLSGGQQAQVGLALALGTRAPVLLLDEPLASLDPLARREFLGVLVAAVRESGTTVLLSSHVIADIEQACDHLVVLAAGRVLLDLSVARAVEAHHVVEADVGPGTPSSMATVGVFPGPDGRAFALIERGGGHDGRPATLEEVVLGHLAAGRDRDATPADRNVVA